MSESNRRVYFEHEHEHVYEDHSSFDPAMRAVIDSLQPSRAKGQLQIPEMAAPRVGADTMKEDKSSGKNSGTHRIQDLARKAPSPIHGHGLFAKVRIAAGQYIGTYEGPQAKRDGIYVLWVYEQEGEPPVGRSGRNLLRWLNHQDEGNAEFDGFDLYAKQDIEPGEEITFNYSGVEFAAQEDDPDSADGGKGYK